jgi:hypothetical protein
MAKKKAVKKQADNKAKPGEALCPNCKYGAAADVCANCGYKSKAK